MAKQAVVVRYTVKPGQMHAFLTILRDHVANTRALEPGCIQFDILLPHEGKDRDSVHLYEVYADELAFHLHNTSEQLARYKAKTEPLLSERNIVWCTVID
jgi:autoinducer 2-degrading protein